MVGSHSDLIFFSVQECRLVYFHVAVFFLRLACNARSLLFGGGFNPFFPVKPRAKIINYFNVSNYFWTTTESKLLLWFRWKTTSVLLLSLLTKFGVFKKLLEFNDSFFIQLVSLLNFMNGISFIYFFLSKTPTANLAKGMTERQLSIITLLNVKLAEKHHKFWRLDMTFALVSSRQRRCF